MKNEYLYVGGMIVVALIVVFIVLPAINSSPSKQVMPSTLPVLPTTVTVSGSVSTAVSGSKPVSIDFKSDVGQTSTTAVKDGTYSTPLDNQHSYTISVRISQSIANITYNVMPSNCGTLQLNEKSDSRHYDISC